VRATPRNASCPCGSGRKFKRCCADIIDHPSLLAGEHEAVGNRIQAWGFKHHRDAIDAALREILADRENVVLDDVGISLIATWALNDRELPGGGTVAQRYAQRSDLPAAERDVARRIASARLGLFRVVSVQPGRWIELDDLAGGERARVMSHDISRTVRPHYVLVGRIMDGPPARSLWGPVGTLTREIGREFIGLLDARMKSLGLRNDPGGLATAMHAAAREITVLLLPGLERVGELDRAA
jgi:SEC-C motif